MTALNGQLGVLADAQLPPHYHRPAYDRQRVVSLESADLVILVRRPGLGRLGPLTRWLLHFGEMVVVMLIGMTVLFDEFAAVANALGYPDAMTTLPQLSTAVMALTMVVPMALWMDYRGHPRRGILEMSAAMGLPVLAVLGLGAADLITPADLAATYHVAMYAAMAGLMAYRWSEYSGGMSHHH